MKMKDFPKELVIGGRTWVVKFRRVIEGNPIYLGMCYFEEAEIHIRLGQSPRERLATLWHEIFHAYEWEYGVKLGHKIIRKLEYAQSDFVLENF
jgi:hypothetical protein